MERGKTFVMSYSCGKDSTLALHKMLAAGHTPLALLVMFNQDQERSWFHGVDRPLLEQNNFLPAPCPEKFSPAGQFWQVAPAVGCGYNADAASASCRSDPAHGRIYPDPDTDTSAEYGAGVTHASWTARAYRNSTSASCRTSLPTPAGA